MSATIALTLRPPDESRETLVADLADIGFDAFEETDEELVAYAPAARWDGPTRELVDQWVQDYAMPPVLVREHASENWNAKWEATIQPMVVGGFVVAPTWAELAPEHAGKTVLRIDPKMAFGTGYHESTRLVLRLLDDAVAPGVRVLDVGTGTGILALAALLRGAGSALGVDIDPWSTDNATENAALNGVSDQFEVREGSMDVVDETGYGLVLANMIRSILAPMLPELVGACAPGAPLVLAGLLRTERDTMMAALADLGWHVVDEDVENEWWACVARAEPVA